MRSKSFWNSFYRQEIVNLLPNNVTSVINIVYILVFTEGLASFIEEAFVFSSGLSMFPYLVCCSVCYRFSLVV